MANERIAPNSPSSHRLPKAWGACSIYRAVRASATLFLLGLLVMPLDGSALAAPAPQPSGKAPAPQPSGKASPSPEASSTEPVDVESLTAPPAGMKPLLLDDAVRDGLARNPRMKVAAEQVVQARARYNELWSGKRPLLNVTNRVIMQQQRTVNTSLLFPQGAPGLPQQVTLVERLQEQFQATLQQLLTTFGRLEGQIAAALVQVSVASQDAETTRRQLLYDIKRAYFDRLRAEANLRVTAMNLESARLTLGDTDLRFRQGLLARYDVLQADLEVVTATQRRDAAETEMQTTEARLAALLFDPSPGPHWMVPPQPVTFDVGTPLAQLETVAWACRPELASLTLSLEAARKLVGAAKADNSASVSMQLGYTTNAGNNLAPSDATNAMLVISWPLIDGGQRNAKVKGAESQLRVIEDNIALQRQAVRQQVQEAWASLLLARQNVDTAQRRLDDAASFHAMARMRFVGGIGTSLEMQNAVRSLNEARLNLVLTRTELDLSFAALEQSLGHDFADRRLTVPLPATNSAAPSSSRPAGQSAGGAERAAAPNSAAPAASPTQGSPR